jgi:curved DNA-binding protein CbpA
LRNRDPEGHYAALNVHPDAACEEIELAYQFLKREAQERRGAVDIAKVRVAYQQVGRPEGRAFYDRRSAESGTRRLAGQLGMPGALGLLLGVLVLVIIWSFAPALRAGLVSYSPGDELVMRADGRSLGKIQRYDSAHEFHNGSLAPAYLVEPRPEAAPVWYPARDLARIARRR